MILVVGATGLVGGMIARRLLERGDTVRVLVRPGSNFQPLADAGAQPVVGDLKDPSSLGPVCAGAETVITTATSGSRGGADNPQTVDEEGNRHLIDTARATGVRQFIFVSALSADEDSPIPLARAKAHTEAYLRASGMPYTILAPNGILEVNLGLVVGSPLRSGKPVTLIGEGRRRHSLVAASDIAAFAVAAVGHPLALNRRIVIGGPEAVSWRDVIAPYERVLSRPVPVEWKAPGELLPNLPPVPGLAELVSGILAALETFDSPVDMTQTARTFGVQLTALDEVVRRETASIVAETAGVPA
jgi:NADH dehydrogenase